MRKSFFLLVFFLNLFGGLWGLDPQKRITQYTLSTWKTERGLPNNTVLAITQDRSGYIWLGTADGLVRFDGVNFTSFDIDISAESKDHLINNLYVDRSGILWIGTLRGKLFSLEKGVFKSHVLAGNVSGMSNCCIAEDDQGNLWVGTSVGLFYCRPESRGAFLKDSTFPSIRIRCLAKDLAGRLMIGTIKQGVNVLEKEKWRRILPDAEKLESNIYVLKQSRDGYLWVGTETGLYSFLNNRLLERSLRPGLNANITVLVEDRGHNLWIGREDGLFRRQGNIFQFLDKELGLGGNTIYSLFEDSEGSLWVGAVDGGLTQIRDEKITAFTEREGLIGSKFRCLHSDDAGSLWISGSGGYLSRYRDGGFENFPLPVRFKDSDINSLEKDTNGSFWLGTDSGLIFFHKGRFREILLPGADPNIAARCVLKDGAGRLWVGTWGEGLFCREGGTITAFSVANGLPGDWVQALFEDRQGNLWVGCENGLAVMAAETRQSFHVEPFLNNCHVFSFYQDEHGTIWVGTHQGLKIYKDGRWGSLNSDRGLFDSRIYSILEDDLGYLWLSSERGIFQARKDELEKAAFNKNLKISGRLFDENDGMKSRVCNFGNPAGWKDRNGRLWFANLAGVVSIDPAHIRKNEKVPPVLVEEVLVDKHNLLVLRYLDRRQDVETVGRQPEVRIPLHGLEFHPFRQDRV